MKESSCLLNIDSLSEVFNTSICLALQFETRSWTHFSFHISNSCWCWRSSWMFLYLVWVMEGRSADRSSILHCYRAPRRVWHVSLHTCGGTRGLVTWRRDESPENWAGPHLSLSSGDHQHTFATLNLPGTWNRGPQFQHSGVSRRLLLWLFWSLLDLCSPDIKLKQVFTVHKLSPAMV